jgi:hypothetical protein
VLVLDDNTIYPQAQLSAGSIIPLLAGVPNMVLNNITRTTPATLTAEEWLGSWLADHLKMIIP